MALKSNHHYRAKRPRSSCEKSFIIVSGGLRLLPLPLEVKVYEGIDDELVDNETERGTDERGAKGSSHLAGGGVLCWVVDYGEGGAGSVSGKESVVWNGTAAVRSADERTAGCVNEPFEEGMTGSHDIVSGVFMKYRGKQGVAEDTV